MIRAPSPNARQRWRQLSLVHRLVLGWLFLSLGLFLSFFVLVLFHESFMLSRQYESLTFWPILTFATLWSITFLSLAKKLDIPSSSVTGRWQSTKRFIKYVVMLPVFVGVFGYVPMGLALPNLLHYIFCRPFEEAVVVSNFGVPVRGRSKACYYRIYAKEFNSFTSGSFCISENAVSIPHVGDSMVLFGQRSWFGININHYSYSPNPKN
jgi:hypothetical protein